MPSCVGPKAQVKQPPDGRGHFPQPALSDGEPFALGSKRSPFSAPFKILPFGDAFFKTYFCLPSISCIRTTSCLIAEIFAPVCYLSFFIFKKVSCMYRVPRLYQHGVHLCDRIKLYIEMTDNQGTRSEACGNQRCVQSVSHFPTDEL